MLQLVDTLGNTIGFAEKLAAHENGGELHRAVSVLVIDDQGRLLIQQRASSKYHFAGKWANTCCTHPLLYETPLEAGSRALRHELGLTTPLIELTRFIYEAHDPTTDLTEREYDHVLVGRWNGPVNPNKLEVADCRWVDADELDRWTKRSPTDFAHWFLDILEILKSNQPDRSEAKNFSQLVGSMCSLEGPLQTFGFSQ